MTQRSPYSGDDEDTVGRWEWPGGGVDEGEDPLTAALREFTEETGLVLPRPYRVAETWVDENYQCFLVEVSHEAWTVESDLQEFETMGIGWFDYGEIHSGTTEMLREVVYETLPQEVMEA